MSNFNPNVEIIWKESSPQNGLSSIVFKMRSFIFWGGSFILSLDAIGKSHKKYMHQDRMIQHIAGLN